MHEYKPRPETYRIWQNPTVGSRVVAKEHVAHEEAEAREEQEGGGLAPEGARRGGHDVDWRRL